MKGLAFGRHAVCIGAATALLAGCGGSQPAIGAPGAMPQSRAAAQHAVRGGSWMLPEAKSERLLYVSAFGGSGVYVLNYPRLKLVGQLTGFFGTTGVCSNASGDIFVTDFQASDIEEFAHGGTSPIQTLADPGYRPFECSVDPATGDLAVTNYQTSQSGAGNVAIFQGSEGQPQFYSDTNISWYWGCSYDDRGNLFITGVSGASDFAELSQGSQNFRDLSLPFKPSGIAWDGRYLTIGSVPRNSSGSVIDRVRLSGDSVNIVKSIPLDPPSKHHAFIMFYAFTSGKVTAAYNLQHVGLWTYPKGGTPILRRSHSEASGVALSTVPAS
jgi:hypothetical protein